VPTTLPLLTKTKIEITLEVRHDKTVNSEDLGRRIAEVVHSATNGLSFDEEKLLHDVQMFGVALIDSKATRLLP
jgi:hypothetical protein